tara:strand:- start:3916 stop:4182 length:267 start_codon:yes stop_codon:yes gene_type:complete
MGGAPRIIKKAITKPFKKKPPPASPIAERRIEVVKKTEPEQKKITRRLKRRTKKRTSLMASVPRPGLESGQDYSPIRNPRDNKTKLGA